MSSNAPSAPGRAPTASKPRATPEELLCRDLGQLVETWRGYARHFAAAERRLPMGTKERAAATANRVVYDTCIEDLRAVLAGRKPMERPCLT